MHCPIDGTLLKMADRSGVEIDYCPKCRGVWLDRGELDKIIERSTQLAPPPPPPAAPEPRQPQRQSYQSDYAHRPAKPRKKEGFGEFLGDIFDF
ncbi:MAG: zf-TFIIB domain-containing protein [Pseudomonadota bacterium]